MRPGRCFSPQFSQRRTNGRYLFVLFYDTMSERALADLAAEI